MSENIQAIPKTRQKPAVTREAVGYTGGIKYSPLQYGNGFQLTVRQCIHFNMVFYYIAECAVIGQFQVCK